jgi:hypothetical protein
VALLRHPVQFFERNKITVKKILLASIFTLGLPALAMAQSYPTAQATSVGQAASQSVTGASQSGVNITETTTDSGNTPADQTIRNNTQAPDIVTSGANACALPIGGSTSVLGFGFGFGATPTDKGCERRDNAAALFAMGYRSAAVAIMCQDDSVARAMRAVGSSCTPDASPVAVSAPQVPIATLQTGPSASAAAAYQPGMTTDQLNAAEATIVTR